eukprot:gene31640-41075_t
MSFNGFSTSKIARDTQRLAATMDVEHTNVRFLNNLTLNLWDCGGQWKFFESYFENESIFRNVEVLIYVFDVDSDLTNEQNPMMNPMNLFM